MQGLNIPVRGLRPYSSLLVGVLAATLAAMLLHTNPARAQQAWSDLSIVRPGGPPAPVPRAASRPAPAGNTDPVSNNTMPSSPSETDRRTAAALALRRTGLRTSIDVQRAQADGETEPPTGPDLALDGHVDVAEPPVLADGIEPIAADPRLPQDSAAFLTPPAGYDALAFQIELDPAADARTNRLARFEPYTPAGRRAGSWVIYPTVEAGIGATSNVYRTSSAKPDLIFDVRPTLLAVTDWQRHALQFKATGLGSAYEKFSTEDDRSYSFEARGRLDITTRSNIEVLAAHSLDQESRSSTFAPTDAKTRTIYATDKIAVAFNQKINRLSLQLRGAVTEIDYHPVDTIAGATLSNDERDLSQRDVAVRAAWSFTPSLATFAEVALNSQTYRALPADGIGRDSTGDRTRAGLSFGSASQIWRGEIAAGYGHQHARDGRLPDVEGILLDANLGWRPTAITSLLFNARTDFLTSTLPGQGGATQRLGSIELRHAFQRQLNGIASLSYQLTEYQGLTLSERTTTGELGFEYYLTQSTTLLGKYSHIILASTAAGAGSTTDTVRFGVRWRP